MSKKRIRVLIRNLVIELILYSVLLTVYLFTVLRFLDDVLARLFTNNLVAYAFIGLGLIVAQGVVLDLLTSFIINQLQLERPE
jgi:hypothetical protein